MLSLTQPQLFLVYVGVVLLLNLLTALIDSKWGRGGVFTAFALLSAALSVWYSVLILQGMRQNLEMELAQPQSWAALGFSIGLIYWNIVEAPIVLSLGVGAVLLAALSRQRVWIVRNAVALLGAVLALLLALMHSSAISAGIDSGNPRSFYDADTQLFQVHLALVVVVLAIQLFYLSYGIWRIRGAIRLRSQSAPAAPLASAQS